MDAGELREEREWVEGGIILFIASAFREDLVSGWVISFEWIHRRKWLNEKKKERKKEERKRNGLERGKNQRMRITIQSDRKWLETKVEIEKKENILESNWWCNGGRCYCEWIAPHYFVKTGISIENILSESVLLFFGGRKLL